MSSEWVEVSVAELCQNVFSGGTPTSTVSEYFDGGQIPWLKTKEVNYSKITSTENHITDSGLKNSSAKLVPINSVIVAMYGNGDTAGRVAINKIELTTNQACCNLIIDGDRADYRFVYYYLQSQYTKLVDLKNGGAQQNLNAQLVRNFPIPAPSLVEQRGISDFLEALDDRITLLRETNATLEAIAQALFKSWFVDFDPVRAKAEGRQPEGMDATTAALFPDSFEESELGLVPKGWSEVGLGQICTFQKGCSYKGDGLSDDQGAYMFNLGCFNTPRLYAFEKVKRYTGDFRDKHRVVAGDLIIANTDMTQHRAILGRPLLVPDGMAPGFVSHHVFKVVINQAYDVGIKPFLFFCFLQPSFRERAVGYATGTTVLALPKDALEQHLIFLPSAELLGVFADCCESIFSSIKVNEEQAQILTQLRDTLLPRLISGQLRLPDAEQAVEEALA